MTDETRTLANFAANFSYEQIPAHVRGHALDLLVDQLGVQIGCSELRWAHQVRETYSRPGGTPEATVVRYGERLPLAAAAFINSTFGHSFEYDDGNPLFHGHPGAELLPPLLAVAEREHVCGRDFLAAFIAAYEIRGRIGWALSPAMMEHGGPQYSTTCGPFGVAAGVARLLGLKAEGIRNALAIAGSFSGGLMQYDHGGGSVKRIYTAIAATAGIQSACLAQAGMTGPEGILEGARGLLRIYSTQYRPERLVSDLGNMWGMERVRFKPYACCGGIHPAIDGLRKLIGAHRLSADDIEAIDVGYAQGFHNHAAIASPHDLLGMQFSTSYSLALTALKGANTPREYTEAALASPAVRDFAARVRIHGEVELAQRFEGRQPARVRVQTRTGAVYEELVTDARGSAAAPLSSAELDDKFRAQVADSFGTEGCERLLRRLRDIDTLDDMALLPPLLVVRTSENH